MGEMREHIISLAVANANPAVGMMEFRTEGADKTIGEAADKIIGAMRQASPDMVKAGEDAIAKARALKRKIDALDIWHAMIDAT